jgi:hypothetical protein
MHGKTRPDAGHSTATFVKQARGHLKSLFVRPFQFSVGG